MKKGGQRLRILYIARYLYEETDETHLLTADKMIEKLHRDGIDCERKAVYADLDALTEYGMDIVRSRRGVYLGERSFELPEVKLLADAVQSSRFITEKKSSELIAKLAKLTSRYQTDNWRGRVVLHNRAKTMNESIYYNIDAIEDAIRTDRQIGFVYYAWNAEKQLVPKKNGAVYVLSPWFFEWENDRYYLVGYDAGTEKMRHYRVDKMKEIRVLQEKRLGRGCYESIDIGAYGRQRFGMFAGEKTDVRFLVEPGLAGVIIDHFGEDVWMHKVEKDGVPYLSVTVETVVNDRFYGWIFGLGTHVRICEPQWAAQGYRERLEAVKRVY